MALHSAQPLLPPEVPLNRRLSELRRLIRSLQRDRAQSPLELCRAIIKGKYSNAAIQSFFFGLPDDERHYWISSLYAALIPDKRRRQLAAYFTPPHLAQYGIQKLIDCGIRLGTDRILDPASGGAAFLVPLAVRMLESAKLRGQSAARVVKAIETTLAGVEIEPDLALLSQELLRDALKRKVRGPYSEPRLHINKADALGLDPPVKLFDAIIGNPPYGRVFRPTKAIKERFGSAITSSYVNLYALFIELALQWVRPGGVVCLIVPTSFLGGPHFANLRKRILEVASVVSVDPIDKRSDVFLDVLFDVCVLLLRKKSGPSRATRPSSSLLLVDDKPQFLGCLDLPREASGRVWALPDGEGKDELFERGLATLADYGYTTRTGYFVWNRERHRYRAGRKPLSSEVPLYWAHNIRPNQRCEPIDSRSADGLHGFARLGAGHRATITTDAIILQRTSNRRQRRRLVASIIRQRNVPGGRGFVSENHTILILPIAGQKPTISLTALCRLLNTEAVDKRFRRISGTVSVSTKALRQLPLPQPSDLRTANATCANSEDAAVLAYARSVTTKRGSDGK